ncbi:mucin-binding protein, partial [Apilactobacillus sp. 1-1-2]|uniref:mucin-binding protein n=1 Tax=Apilactobacillus sp. 1-1-2 TaxID=3411035 RepID=UPI003B9578F7
MLYNHKQFRKNSDKKIMRKVKKNWIVLSIASFALIGAATVIESNSNVAFASETQTSSSASSISNSTSDTDSSNSSNNSTSDTDSSNSSNNSTSGTDSSNSSNNSSGGTNSSKHSTNNTNGTDESISNRESNSNNDSKDSAIPVTQVPNTSKSQDYTPSNSQDLKNSVDSAKNNGVVFNESSNQKNEMVKDKAVSDATDVQNYNQNKINEITQAVNNYKAHLSDYQNKLDYYNDQLNKYSDEINKAKQLQNQGIIDASLLTQQLDLGDEPNAKLSVSGVGNGLILNNNSTSPIKNAGVSDSEQASRISYDGTGSYNGGQVAVASFTNLKNSYYQDIIGVKHNISKIVETFSNLSSQPYAGSAFLKSLSSGIAAVNYTTPALTIYHNPSHGFVFGASSGVTMKTEYYDDSGNLIPLNDESNAYLVIGSLNNWSDHREGIFVSNDSDAHPYQLNGSSVTKHATSSGTAMYSDNGNPTTPDGHLWDSAGSQYSYYGSSIVKLTGSNNSVRFTRDASSFDSFPFVWATVASSLVGQSAAIPNLFKPLQPSKPVLDVNYTAVNLINGINKINYVDENNNNIGLTDSSYGDNSQGDGLTTSSKISNFEKMGYSLLSDNHGDDSKNYIGGIEQDFTVMFSHKVDTVTPDQPGEPGQPINPANPDGPKWPNGTDKDSLSKSVNQTINYVDSNGNVIYNPTNYHVTFTRTAKVDEVTGEVTYSDWDKPDYKFSDTVSPVIKNYVINEDSQKVIAGVTVGPISSDNVNNINVVYSLRPNLDGEATKVKGEIDADNTLTSAEKAQQKNNVDSVKNIDQAKIDVSSDLNNANAAYDQGVKDIDAQHVPGKSVADQKEAAKANLDSEATKVKGEIDADNTLTSAEKAQQKSNV